MRIAMWSGPRNLSTALMYSFAARDDFCAMDEPFYAAYLAASGLEHPMRAEILAAQPTEPARAARICVDATGRPHLYMKHMAQHMLPGFPIEWAADCVNVHLIRHPARVIASYAAKRENPTLEDIGFAQQAMIYERFGGVVIDSTDLRANPEGMLRSLCDSIGLGFDPAMLHWPAGPRAYDGIWARHWYAAVHRTKGFAGAEGEIPVLETHLQGLCDRAMPFFHRLEKEKIEISPSV